MRRSLQSAQKGFALLLVMVIGTVALYAATGLIGGGAVTEHAAQEKQLLKLRSYWAAQGHIVYTLSRSRQGLPCGGTCSDMRQRSKFFDDAQIEILDHKNGNPDSSNKAKDRHWFYPEIDPNYFMPIHFHVEDAEAGSRLLLRAHFKPENFLTHPLIRDYWPINGSFAAIICTGLTTFADPCPVDEGSMDEANSLARIIRMEPR
jgi:hypothetical protein